MPSKHLPWVWFPVGANSLGWRYCLWLNTLHCGKSTPMLSTANATHAWPLSHTGPFGRFTVAATIRQVRYARQCAKNKMFSLTNKNQITHSKRTCPTAKWLKGGEWAKQTQQPNSLNNRSSCRSKNPSEEWPLAGKNREPSATLAFCLARLA